MASSVVKKNLESGSDKIWAKIIVSVASNHSSLPRIAIMPNASFLAGFMFFHGILLDLITSTSIAILSRLSWSDLKSRKMTPQTSPRTTCGTRTSKALERSLYSIRFTSRAPSSPLIREIRYEESR